MREAQALLRELIEFSVLFIEALGIFVILAGIVWALVHVVVHRERWSSTRAFDGYRRSFGRSILLGLEFLVAADIIRTVTEEPSLDNVLVLGMIVLIRTFLSFTLEIELEGRPPWRREEKT